MKYEQQVERKVKLSTKILKIVMVVFAVLFLVAAIAFTTGYMLFCFIFAALYLYFEIRAKRSYEYVYENGTFSVYVIYGNRKRVEAHRLDMTGLEVIAPPHDERVRAYRKDGGGVKIAKYDYTSYDDEIPYYTMIVYEGKVKIKLLLDLNEDMLNAIRVRCPGKVVL